MVFFAQLALACCYLYPALVDGMPGKRQDVNIQTTFEIDQSCDADQATVIRQAHLDALTLANAALDDDTELLAANTNDPHKTIDFKTQAAIDYWGPPGLGNGGSDPYQQKVYDTFYRATQTYRGTGWSDYWNNRYVWIFCNDPAKDCGETSPAYQVSAGQIYPYINYCPPFFQNLSSHQTMVNTIKQDVTGVKMLNVRNLRSQATTALHEWLHIRGFTSEVCVGGCEDTWQTIGGVRTRTYKAGRAKLLARKDPEQAANTNDNYAYFAMARFMEKTFDKYPEFPLAWSNSRTPAQNQENENLQPGAPPSVQSWELDDSSSGDAEVSADTPLVDANTYPEWYRPILAAAGATSAPTISAPASSPIALAQPSIDAVVCNTNNASAIIADCSHAFMGGWFAEESSSFPIPHKNNTQTHWLGYVETCALEMLYTGDWRDDCKATESDFYAHASTVFEACEDGGLGKVGGYVPFGIANCPGQVHIVPSNGQVPT